jgi:hypothetical protein
MSEELSPFLTDLEVVEFTGYKQPKRQAQWIVENYGIRPAINGRGKVRILRAVHEIMTNRRAPQQKTEPDFTHIRRTG